MEKTLGTIAQIDLRDIFKDEARDLTPWLAKEENLGLLADEIGVDLELVQTEANVGNYNVDILAQEVGTGRKVIIENQLEPTNHDHLGKIITYAAGHEAKIIVWIFREIRDEHREAIDWLNENTNEDVSFFAIQLELWKIGDSLPAPKFEIISNPNEWAKTIRSTGNVPQGVTEVKLKQLEFWTKQKSYLEAKHKGFQLQKPLPQNWTNVKLGSSIAHSAVTVNFKEKRLIVEVYIDDNKNLFDYLFAFKEEIENKISERFDWDNTPRKASRIKLTREDLEVENENRYPEYFDWVYEKITKFQKVFPSYIKDFRSK